MAQSSSLPIIYGIVTIITIYFVIRMLYSVEYTPGTTVIYNSPIAQKLFPNATKLFPTWGSNKAGMYDNQPFRPMGILNTHWPPPAEPVEGTNCGAKPHKLPVSNDQRSKFGQADFWPEKGGGFKPNKFGSTGASPTGGMRPHFDIPAETDVGYWGYTPEPVRQVSLDIYDNSGKPPEYIINTGWWGTD